MARREFLTKDDFKETCEVCGKNVESSLISNKYVDSLNKSIKVCRECILTGYLEKKYGGNDAIDS